MSSLLAITGHVKEIFSIQKSVTERVLLAAKLETTEPQDVDFNLQERLVSSRIVMSTATLSNAPATQLTFPWAMPRAERAADDAAATICEASLCARTIVADRSPPIERPATPQPGAAAAEKQAVGQVSAAAVGETSLAEVMVGDRIGKTFRVGSVMFRLLKSYGITDEEIAEGIAQYTAKRSAFR